MVPSKRCDIIQRLWHAQLLFPSLLCLEHGACSQKDSLLLLSCYQKSLSLCPLRCSYFHALGYQSCVLSFFVADARLITSDYNNSL